METDIMMEFKEVAVLDRNTESLGIPTITLMENAGKGLAGAIEKRAVLHGKKTILFICGLGNNGGDGFVAARHLRKKYPVTMVLMGEEKYIKTDISRTNFERIKEKVTLWQKPSDHRLDKLIRNHDVVIDAMLGAGLKSAPREPYATAVKLLNHYRLESLIFSVDVATGLGTELNAQPKYTVTFHKKKVGMTPENSGEIIVVDIGIPKKAEEYTGPGEFVFFPRPKPHSHKGNNGILAVIGGGPYTGAPLLSAHAALRSGCDLVHLIVPKKNFNVTASYLPDFIVHPYDADHLSPLVLPEILEVLEGCTAVVLGPGLGRSNDTCNAVLSLLKKIEIPMVVDADGLYALSRTSPDFFNRLKGREVVLTPHSRELKRLMSKDESLPGCSHIDARKEKLGELVGRFGCTLLLKGHVDVIYSNKGCKLNKTGNPGMTVGGTGDLLSGIVGSLLARGLPSYNAARLGAYICGSAGDLAYDEMGISYIASDLLDILPHIIKTGLELN